MFAPLRNCFYRKSSFKRELFLPTITKCMFIRDLCDSLSHSTDSWFKAKLVNSEMQKLDTTLRIYRETPGRAAGSGPAGERTAPSAELPEWQLPDTVVCRQLAGTQKESTVQREVQISLWNQRQTCAHEWPWKWCHLYCYDNLLNSGWLNWFLRTAGGWSIDVPAAGTGERKKDRQSWKEKEAASGQDGHGQEQQCLIETTRPKFC